MEKNTLLMEKAKLFESNAKNATKEIRVLEEELDVNLQRYIREILENLEDKSINLEHTNESTYILEELSYIDRVFIGEDNDIYVQYRLFDDVENGINEQFEEPVGFVEFTGVKDIFFTIVQELKRINELS